MARPSKSSSLIQMVRFSFLYIHYYHIASESIVFFKFIKLDDYLLNLREEGKHEALYTVYSIESLNLMSMLVYQILRICN